MICRGRLAQWKNTRLSVDCNVSTAEETYMLGEAQRGKDEKRIGWKKCGVITPTLFNLY